MTQYTPYTNLPDLETVVGTFKFTLYSEFSGLIVPTRQTIKSIGELEEIADREVGITEFSTLNIQLVDDYTNYNEGFWYKVLSGECKIRIYLVEPQTGTTFYFFGIPQPEATVWGEKALVGGTYLRSGDISLVSVGKLMFDTPLVDWMNEVYTHKEVTNLALPTHIFSAISIPKLFSAMLSASKLNNNFGDNDASFVYGEADLVFINNADIELRLDQLYIPISWDNNGGTGEAPVSYWNPNNDNYLPKKYATIGAILKPLLDNFGVYMRMSYDPQFEKHKIQLIQRGRAYPNDQSVNFGNREKESTIAKSTALTGDAVKATKLINSNHFVWFSKKYSPTGSWAATEPPNFVEFDVEMTAIFIITPNFNYGDGWVLYGTPGTLANLKTIKDVKYYNYTSNAPVTASASTNELKMLEAMAGYQFYKFSNLFTQITRRYGKLTANNGGAESHEVLGMMRRTMIHDGSALRPFYANRVTKNADESEVEIDWFADGTIVEV